ncbi:MAG: hypothetical protein A4E55_02244 [Pelotomaculum sp. PtaU1.Bin035]|nr:MAG: hypothetical protein A4E55_02244 [Pelotomaculum sp. PtaU1.Bin035]
MIPKKDRSQTPDTNTPYVEEENEICTECEDVSCSESNISKDKKNTTR